MLKLEALQIFCRVAELSSFTGAADALGLPKATVSVAVRDLEAALGVRLFNRTTRRVQTTHDGAVFYQRCKDLLSDADDLASMFEAGHVSGRIRVDAPANMMNALLVPALPNLLNGNPGLEVELSSTDRRVDVVREGFDCVIRVGELSDSGLIARPLARAGLVNCASPAYLERYGTPKTPRDLEGHRLVRYAQQFGAPPEKFEFWEGDKLHEVEMRGSVTVNQTQSFVVAALTGLGIIQTPRLGVAGELAEGSLVEILPD
jgi:DNA-binding transcriptional LysR family regulator